MKIALVAHRFPTLSQTFVTRHAQALLKRGHEVHVYAEESMHESRHRNDLAETDAALAPHLFYGPAIPRERTWRALKGVGLLARSFHRDPGLVLRALDARRFGRKATSLDLLYRAVNHMDRPRSYDIVHCHFGPTAVRVLELRDLGLLSGKLVTTFHGYDMTRQLEEKGQDFYARLFDRGDLFLPISERWGRQLAALGCHRKKIEVHRMGVDLFELEFEVRRPPSDGVVKIVSVARLVEKKGIEYGIRAIAEVARSEPRIRYEIVGDGPLREPLERLTDELGVRSIVRFRGWKDHGETLETLRAGHVCLAPSVTAEDGDQEGIPVQIMEAMGLGMPVVSTLHSGIPELVDDGTSGILVPERNPVALANALVWMVRRSNRWGEMGRAGRKAVEKRHDDERLIQTLIERYRGLC